MSDSDDSEDVPISQLRKQMTSKKQEEPDEKKKPPVKKEAAPKAASAKKAKKEVEKDDDDDDDSEDDFKEDKKKKTASNGESPKKKRRAAVEEESEEEEEEKPKPKRKAVKDDSESEEEEKPKAKPKKKAVKDDDSDDDDKPMVKPKRKAVQDDSEDDDEEEEKPRPKKKAAKDVPEEEEEDDDDEKDSSSSEDDDESDDDVPISQLRKSKEPEKPKVAVKRKSRPKSISNSDEATVKRNFKKQQGGGLKEGVFYSTKRGAFVQALLRRWWYAIEWPSADCKDRKPEANFETMPSFPGVHVCTAGDRLGEIVDHRDHSSSPCFKNLYTKPTSELKDLLLVAYKKQIEALVESEGESTYAQELRKEMSLAAKVNTQKADADAVKAVAAYKNCR